jgi:pimeloyl-ACP methyl ester carboxylesterase
MPDPIVLLPGLICTAELFAAQTRALETGRSVVIAETRLDDTLGAMAERLLKSAPDRFALCGLSMGGYLAFEIMRRAPERVTRLALLDTTPKPDTPESRANRERLIALTERGGFDRVLAEMWTKLVSPSRHDGAWRARLASAVSSINSGRSWRGRTRAPIL